MAVITNEQLMDEFIDVMKEFRHTAEGCGCGIMHAMHPKDADKAMTLPEDSGPHGHHKHGHHGPIPAVPLVEGGPHDRHHDLIAGVPHEAGSPHDRPDGPMAAAPPEEGGPHGHHKHGHHGPVPGVLSEDGHHHGHHKHHGPGPGHDHHGPMRMQMQERVMRLIRQKPGITTEELSEEAHAPAHGIQRIVDRLEHEGLADVNKDGDKILSATLTDAGVQRSEKESAAAAKRADAFFGVLTEPEKEQLSTLFLKLTQPAAPSN